MQCWYAYFHMSAMEQQEKYTENEHVHAEGTGYGLS
jgi:hypothetical protein